MSLASIDDQASRCDLVGEIGDGHGFMGRAIAEDAIRTGIQKKLSAGEAFVEEGAAAVLLVDLSFDGDDDLANDPHSDDVTLHAGLEQVTSMIASYNGDILQITKQSIIASFRANKVDDRPAAITTFTGTTSDTTPTPIVVNEADATLIQTSLNCFAALAKNIENTIHGSALPPSKPENAVRRVKVRGAMVYGAMMFVVAGVLRKRVEWCGFGDGVARVREVWGQVAGLSKVNAPFIAIDASTWSTFQSLRPDDCWIVQYTTEKRTVLLDIPESIPPLRLQDKLKCGVGKQELRMVKWFADGLNVYNSSQHFEISGAVLAVRVVMDKFEAKTIHVGATAIIQATEDATGAFLNMEGATVDRAASLLIHATKDHPILLDESTKKRSPTNHNLISLSDSPLIWCLPAPKPADDDEVILEELSHIPGEQGKTVFGYRDEKARVLRELREWINGDGRMRTVIVEGPSGIGKSTVLDFFVSASNRFKIKEWWVL
ncbi:hypothetical protein HDU67_006628 [Dinochytrium kinnereticum]|nr:hypothetical protein HDU67_006628 [Dinochytrium kinnereticum]